MRDVHVVGQPEPAAAQGGKHNRHFHDLVLTILKGMISWVRQTYPPGAQTLRAAMDLCGLDEAELRVLADEIDRWKAGPARFVRDSVMALHRLSGTDEGTSFATTMMIELAFASDEHLGASLARSSFDPLEIAGGAVDIFIVIPQQHFRMSAPYLRMWMALPTMIAHRRAPDRDILVYLDPVVDSFTMAAGSGVHYWCFVQSLSALDASYGKEARALILENAEVVQALGFPRYAPELADEFARAVGHATFRGRQDSRSGSSTFTQAGTGALRDQTGVSEGLVKETVIAPDDLLRLPEGEQIVIASTRQAERNAMRLRHARYWTRRDCAALMSPDPLEVCRQA